MTTPPDIDAIVERAVLAERETTMREKPAFIEMHKLYSHPLAVAFAGLVAAIENLGCSPEITAALNRCGDVGKQVEEEINRLARNSRSDAELLQRYHAWCKSNGFEPSTSDLYSHSAHPNPSSPSEQGAA